MGDPVRITQGGLNVLGTDPSPGVRATQAGLVVVGRDTGLIPRRITQAGFVVARIIEAPSSPVVEVDQIGGQSARALITPVARDLWKIRVRLASTSAVVFTSDAIDGEEDFYRIPSETLTPLTDYEISGMIRVGAQWSEWGDDFAFTTLDNYTPSAPGAWLEPTEGTSHSGAVSLISEEATDLDGDELSYETWFSVDGGAWQEHGGASFSEVHELLFSVGTVIEYKRRAFDGQELGPFGDTVSITVDALPEKPVISYVELIAPGEVRGVLDFYTGASTHASSRYQIQEEGGDWTGADVVDTGFVSGTNLLVSPDFTGLSSTTEYEMRALQRSDLDVDTPWSDAVWFSPLGEVTTFDEVSPLAGFTGDTGNFGVLQVPGTHGGACLVDKSPGSLVWTGGGLTSGFSVRVMNHWNAEHGSAPIVIRGGLGHTLSFLISPGLGGYFAKVDFFNQHISVGRFTDSGQQIPGKFVMPCDLPPDRWHTISLSVRSASELLSTILNPSPPPIITSAKLERNFITIVVNGTFKTFIDDGFYAAGTSLSAGSVPVRGYVTVRSGFVGEGMRRFDYLVSGGGVTTSELETFAATDVPFTKTPVISRPRAGEVFDAAMTLDLGAADAYQVSSDGGTTWGADVVYAGSEVLDVSGWVNGYEYMIRAKSGISAWSYSQKFSIDHRATPICYHKYFGDEDEWGDVSGMTKMWEQSGVWLFYGQYERLAIPPNALIHGLVTSGPSAIVVDEFPSARNGEIRALIRNYHDMSGSGVFGRGSGENSSESRGYWASCVRAWENRLYRYESGSRYDIGALPPFKQGVPMMVAMRIVEGRIGIKTWVADALEPDDWMVVRDDEEIDEIGVWGVARRGFYYNKYPGNFESISFVNLDSDAPPEIIPEPGIAEITEKAWAFVLDGHTFYVLNRFDAPALVCDLSTGQWHEWFTDLPPVTVDGESYWNMHRGIMWKGRVIACDLSDPIIWELDPHSFDDQGGILIHRAVTAAQPHRGSHSKRQGSLRLSARREGRETSTRVTMRFSDDGGRTWSGYYDVLFEADAYSKRIEYRSLGRVRAPGRIWEFTDAGGLVRIEGADSDMEEDDG